MLENLKIRDRILVGYTVPIILFFFFSGIVGYNAFQIGQLLDRQAKAERGLNETSNMLFRTAQMAQKIRGYLLVKNSEGALDKYEQEKQKYQEALGNGKKIFEEYAEDPRQKEIVTQMEQLGSEYNDVRQEISALKVA